MTVEILYPELCNLYGDRGNIDYLRRCLPADYHQTQIGDEPWFVQHEVDLIYLCSMTERSQERVIRALTPYRERLAELGGEIGSDVGFFIYGAASRCTGRGEKVEPLPEWKGWRPRVVLLKPSFGVSTPDAYRRWSGSRELPGIPYGEQDVDGHVLVNDLERPVFEKHLFLAEVKRWLMGRPGVRGAMMSGSGSTMFAVVEDEGTGRALMEDAARELDPTLWMWSGLVMQDDAR